MYYGLDGLSFLLFSLLLLLVLFLALLLVLLLTLLLVLLLTLLLLALLLLTLLLLALLLLFLTWDLLTWNLSDNTSVWKIDSLSVDGSNRLNKLSIDLDLELELVGCQKLCKLVGQVLVSSLESNVGNTANASVDATNVDAVDAIVDASDAIIQARQNLELQSIELGLKTLDLESKLLFLWSETGDDTADLANLSDLSGNRSVDDSLWGWSSKDRCGKNNDRSEHVSKVHSLGFYPELPHGLRCVNAPCDPPIKRHQKQPEKKMTTPSKRGNMTSGFSNDGRVDPAQFSR
ncbi:hypothetical protein EDD86DRAFT_219982 [Gorgonomyces haynaldii]|nr:hypothetical protein EDD86DRAFT_219982 [Gorgonomyces haynaldii]